ncbi:MAG: hypothetical protein ACFFCQ_16065 [Promethearchaeota archaeon]
MTQNENQKHWSLPSIEKAIAVFLDLDHFAQVMKERGWTRYSPNIVTGTLTNEVETLARKYLGTIHWGLDYDEGTEEALILMTHVDLEELILDLELLREKIEKQAVTTISIGVGIGPEGKIPKELKSGKREHSLLSSPAALMAKRALKKAKKKSNCICIEFA